MGLYLTDPNCIKEREIVGLPAWDKYDGEGITIFHSDIYNDGHCAYCKDIHQVILPKARILSGLINHSSNNTGITSCTIKCFETEESLPFEEFIVKYNVSQINNSTGADDNGDDMQSPLSDYMNKMIAKYNLFCTGAAGNFKGMTNKFQGAFVLVSGINRMADGSWRDYGSPGKPVDFSMFMGYQDGTSFSAPMLNAMGGKLRNRYGRNISQQEIYIYLKNNCKDLGIEGRDPEYGWGLPILPSPDRKYVTMEIGKKNYYVDGKEFIMDTAPVIKESRTFIPLRVFSEALGAIVDWKYNDKKKIQIIIKYKNDTIILNQDEKTIYKNGSPIELDVAVFINSDGRTMAPLRGIIEILNGQVDWIAELQKVIFLEGE